MSEAASAFASQLENYLKVLVRYRSSRDPDDTFIADCFSYSFDMIAHELKRDLQFDVLTSPGLRAIEAHMAASSASEYLQRHRATNKVLSSAWLTWQEALLTDDRSVPLRTLSMSIVFYNVTLCCCQMMAAGGKGTHEIRRTSALIFRELNQVEPATCVEHANSLANDGFPRLFNLPLNLVRSVFPLSQDILV